MRTLIASYLKATQAYPARAGEEAWNRKGDYDHLSRWREWGQGSDQASDNGVKCGLAAPYYEIDGPSDFDLPLSTETLLNLHYTKPLTIQTCLCSAGINGVQILEGNWIVPPTDELTILQ